MQPIRQSIRKIGEDSQSAVTTVGEFASAIREPSTAINSIAAQVKNRSGYQVVCILSLV